MPRYRSYASMILRTLYGEEFKGCIKGVKGSDHGPTYTYIWVHGSVSRFGLAIRRQADK